MTQDEARVIINPDGSSINTTPVHSSVYPETSSQEALWNDRDMVHKHRQVRPELAEHLAGKTALEIYQEGGRIYDRSKEPGEPPFGPSYNNWMVAYYSAVYLEFQTLAARKITESLVSGTPFPAEHLVETFLNGNEDQL